MLSDLLTLLASALLEGGAEVLPVGGIPAVHTIERSDEIILAGEGLQSVHVYSDGVEYWLLD